MARVVLPLLLLLSSAAPAAASPLDRLLTEDLLPGTRQELVAEACSAPAGAQQLRPLFRSPRRTPPLDATHVALCQHNPELIDLMFEEFVRSALGVVGGTDPDIFERLLRGLQAFPFEVVRDRLSAADSSLIVESVDARFRAHWLDPASRGARAHSELAGAQPGHDGPLPSPLDLAQQAGLQDAVDDWLEQLLGMGPSGLIHLQTDSGEALVQLEVLLQARLLAAMIEHGTPSEARTGLELARQIPQSGRLARAAAQRRLERGGPPDLADLAERVPDDPPAQPLPREARLYPVGGLEVELPAGNFTRPAQRQPLPASTVALLAGLALLAAWLLVLRRWPSSRKLLFPLGAVLCGFLLLLLAELLLTVLGVRPLSELRPALDPNRTEGSRYERVTLEGLHHVVSSRPEDRYRAFRVPKPEGLQRVVTLGESSVHGTHYLAEETFSTLLEAALGPDTEVINAGVGAALSDDILLTGLEALEWEPDLLVLYFGFNDLTHIPAMDRYQGVNLSGMSLRRQVGSWRLARVLHRLLPDHILDVDAALPASLDAQAQSPELALDLLDFAQQNAAGNIVRLSLAAEDAGVDVLLVAQATNERSCTDAQDRLQRVQEGCYRDELSALYDAASARLGLPVQDSAAVMRAIADPSPGRDSEVVWAPLFYDAVHPTRRGHAVLAASLAPTVRERLKRRASAGRP